MTSHYITIVWSSAGREGFGGHAKDGGAAPTSRSKLRVDQQRQHTFQELQELWQWNTNIQYIYIYL